MTWFKNWFKWTPKVGSYANWEVNGAIQWETPRRILSIDSYQGQRYAFVEGSSTGIPYDQLIKP